MLKTKNQDFAAKYPVKKKRARISQTKRKSKDM